MDWQMVRPTSVTTEKNQSENAVKCECISKLLSQIRQLLQRKLEYARNNELDLYNHKWCLLYSEFILNNAHCTVKNCNVRSDDMLWFIAGDKEKYAHLQVFRRQSKNKPIVGDKFINWEETVCLNFILQQLDYYVTCAVCTKSPPNNLQIHRKVCHRVYPSPSRRRMDMKGECEEITYPCIYFAIDNFDEVFNNIVVTEGECVCVELIAHDRFRNKEAVLFLGSIRHDIIQDLYSGQKKETWGWAQKLINNAPKRRYEFVIMHGPRRRGRAEMAIARADSYGYETPMSDTFDFRSAFDEKLNNGKQRRVSETNMFNLAWRSLTNTGGTFRREAMTPGPSLVPPYQRRWQNDSVSARSECGAISSRYVDGEYLEEIVSGRTKVNSPGTWSVRGIGEALRLLQEKQENTPLNAFLTNVMLPWNSILEDIMSASSKPLLTFELDLFQ